MANRLKKKNKDKNTVSAVSWIIAIYLIVMFVFYPLYARGGYVSIDDTKYLMYKIYTITGICIMVPSIIVAIITKAAGENWKSRLSLTDIFVGSYMVLILLSTILSNYKEAAMYGQAGWFLGCILLESCGLIYFIVSRFYSENVWVTGSAVTGSFIVFFLGALNRFGSWPIDMEIPGHTGFISTIGNIGWYCGFLAVVAPLGIGIYIFKDEMSTSLRVLLGMYAFITFFTGSSQGSDTIYVIYAVLFVGILLFTGIAGNGLDRLLEIAILWCISLLSIAFIRKINPDAYHYETDNICGLMNGGLIGLWILIPIVLIYILVKTKKIAISYKAVKYIGLALVGIGVLVVFMEQIIVFMSARYYFHDMTVEDGSAISKFIIDYEWGNGRGATMMVGLECFAGQDIVHKIFGVGPDCLASASYYDEQLSLVSQQMFDQALIANAHNEIITNLVQTGIFGLIAYYGMLVSFVIRSIRSAMENKKVLIYALCIISATGYALFNYAHILSLPFLFIIMAIGEGIMKKQKI